MFHTRSRSLAVIASGLVLGAALTGCGSSDEEKTADKTGTSATSSPSPSDDASAASSGDSADAAAFITKVTEAMKKAGTAHLVLELGSSMSADADFEYKGDTTAMRMKMNAGGHDVQVILVDGAMYLQQAAGGKFVKIDKNDPSMGSLLGQFGNLGPAQSLDALKSGLSKVDKVGTEEIDGKKYDKYELTIDTAAIKDTLGSVGSKADLPKTVTYTMYVDGDDLLRRINMEIGGQKVVMNATDWGKSVKITAPPADQIQAR